MQYSFKMSKMGRQIKNFFIHGCNFWWFFFSDFGPIYKVINKSAQEKSPEEKKTWGDNPSLVQNITSSVSTLRQLNATMASKKILKEYVFGVLTGINDWLIDCDTEICDKEDIDTKICDKQDIDTKHVSIFSWYFWSEEIYIPSFQTIFLNRIWLWE